MQARFAHAHILRTGTLDAGEAGSRGGRRRARRASALLAEARGGTVPGGPRRAGGRRGAGRAADFCVGKSRRQGGRAGGGALRHTYEGLDCAIGAAAFSGPREPFGGSGRGWGVTGHGVWQGHGDGGGGRPHTFFDGWSGGCCTPHVPRGPTNWHGSVHGCVRSGRILGHLHWANDEFDSGNEGMMCLQRTDRGLVRAPCFRGLQTAPRGRRGHTLRERFAHTHILYGHG